jgi:pSer/pThr/pTyr-binding forkhead associated (FHA) protein
MTAILILILRFALAIALYAFLGWILSILWQEVRQQGELLASQKKPVIKVLAKLESGKEIQQRYSQTEVTIGRDPNCDFPILDEAISAHHARVSFHHSQWWLEDLNSTNGTFIGKSRVSVPVVLIASDQFKCGNTLFTVDIDALSEKLDL